MSGDYPAGGLLAGSSEPSDGAQLRVGSNRLLGRVSPGVTLRHREVGVPEQHLHVDLPRTQLDRPGRERVAEAIRENFLHSDARP